MSDPIIGQEAICPDGLGRVKSFNFGPPCRVIQVETYVNNNSSVWSADNVELIQINKPVSFEEINDNLQTIISQLDNIFIFMKNT